MRLQFTRTTKIFGRFQSCEPSHDMEIFKILKPVLLLLQIEIPPSDLGATESLNETLSLLREVLSSHDASVVPFDVRQGDYSKVWRIIKELICRTISIMHVSFMSVIVTQRLITP